MVSSSAARRSGVERRPAPRPAPPPGPGCWPGPRRRSAACTRGPRPPRDGARRRRSAGPARCAASTSSPARGSTGPSFSLVSWAADDPRRSILESTRPVYGAGPGRRRARPHRGHAPSRRPPARAGRAFRPGRLHSAAGRSLGPGRVTPAGLALAPVHCGARPSRDAATCRSRTRRPVPCRLPSARPPAARTRWRSGRPATARHAASRRSAGWRADDGSWPAPRAPRSRA